MNIRRAQKHYHYGYHCKYRGGQHIRFSGVAEELIEQTLLSVCKQRKQSRAQYNAHVGKSYTYAVERGTLVIVVRHIGCNCIVRDIYYRPRRVEQHIGERVINHLAYLPVGTERRNPQEQKRKTVRHRAEEHIYSALAPLALCFVTDSAHHIVGNGIPEFRYQKYCRSKFGFKSADVDEKVEQIERDCREHYVGRQISETVKDFFFELEFHNPSIGERV